MGDTARKSDLIPKQTMVKNLQAMKCRNLEPESIATPTVQNWPNFFSEATLIPLSSTVTRVSPTSSLPEMYDARGKPGSG